MNDFDTTEDIIEYFSMETSEGLIKNRQEISNKIEQWLIKKKEIDTKLKNNYEILKHQEQLGRASTKDPNKYYDLSSAGLKRLVDEYKKQKNEINHLQDALDFEEHLKNGYRIIHYFRDTLTNQEIVYNIAYAGDGAKGENLLTANLTMEQILSTSFIYFSDIFNVKEDKGLTDTMKIAINSTSIKKILENPDMENVEQIIQKIDDPALLDSLMSIRETNLSGYKGNLGQIYEAYFELNKMGFNFVGHKEGEANTINKSISAIKDAIKDRTPGWKAGDVGNTQLKAVLNGSMASLISIGSVEKVLTKLVKVLRSTSKAQLKKGLLQLFTTDLRRIKGKYGENLQRDAKKYIEDLIERMFDKW